MTIRITKLIKIFEIRYIEGLSIQKIANKLKLNKNTVVKYLKLFPHGFNSYEVNIKSIKNKTFLSNIRPSLEKIQLPIDTVEDELEDNHLENTVISLNQQITKLNEDINNLIEEIENKTQVIQELNQKNGELEEENIHLDEENHQLREQVVSKDEEIENKTQLIQEQNNQQIKQKEDYINLEKELYRCQEQLLSKDIEIKNKTQLIEELKDNAQIIGLQAKMERIRELYDQSEMFKKINAILDRVMNKNEMKNMIQKVIQERFFQDPPSIVIDTVQKESYLKKPEIVQNIEKVQKPDLEVKKSSNNEYGFGIDPLQIWVLSMISAGKGIQKGLNNSNQIVISK